MAEEKIESLMDLEEFNENGLILLQAHVRGVLTRQSLHNLRRQFEETCCEIENKSLNIDWQRNSVCLPIITRYRKRPAKSSTVSQKTESIPETHSVEIQTVASSDFIDKINKPDETESDTIKKDYPTGTLSDLVTVGNNSPRYLEKNTFEQTDVKIDKSFKEENLDCTPVKETVLTDEQSSAYETENCLSNAAGITQQPEVSCVGDMTSVWETQNSSYHLKTEESLPTNQTELSQLRQNLAMELLWIQQAIQSRKNYLKIKDEMV